MKVTTLPDYEWWINPGSVELPEYGDPGPIELDIMEDSPEFRANFRGIDWRQTAQNNSSPKVLPPVESPELEPIEDLDPEDTEPGVPDPRGSKIVEALSSLFGLDGESWFGWRTFVKVLYGVPLESPEELELFCQCTAPRSEWSHRRIYEQEDEMFRRPSSDCARHLRSTSSPNSATDRG